MTDVSITVAERVGVVASSAEPVDLTSADLEQLWSELMPDTYAGRRGRSTFLDSVRAQAGVDSQESDLQFRPGGWQIAIAGSSVQSVLAGALLGGLLVAIGATGIPAAVIAAVVPTLFDVEKVRLNARQEYVLADLVGHREALDGSLSTDALYARLTAETRQEVSRIDFAEFLDACRRAGMADFASDGTVTLRPSDKARFRITWK